MKPFARVLIVEDEPAIAELIAVNLRHNGMVPIWAEDGLSAQREINTQLPDVILLDWMLPGMSGVQLARQWRVHPRTKAVPILMLTARGDEPDKVAGLDAGADDYLTKPFQVAELVARVQALVRRAAGNASSILEIGGVRLDMAASQVWYEGTPIKLTAHEFRVLGYLMQHRGKVVSRSELIDHIYAQDFDRDSNTVEVFIGRIRKKTHADLIETVRGLGYRINE